MAKHIKQYVLAASAGLLFTISTAGQTLPAYKNPALPIPERVNDLLARMTPEEKFWQLFMIPGEVKAGEEEKYKQGIFGFQVSAQSAGNNAANQMLQYNAGEDALALAQKINRVQRFFVEQSRLGIPIIAFDEALHGLVRGGATAFPQAIALAATWDTALVSQVATAIAIESKARGIRQILSPVINLANDVRWGRTEETYGEDPYLSAMMGVAFMGAFERMNIITTPKHFLANVGDGGRDSYPIHWSKRYLQETHLVPFKAAFEKAGARSVMTSYTSVNGQPSSANQWILLDWLKKQQNFNGFVISDAGATGGSVVLHNTSKDYPQSGEQAINNGLDVIFQTDYEHFKLFIPPFLNGKIDAARLDDAVRRVLTAKFELGLFEHPYVDENAITKLINVQKHKALAATAASKSFVLLKNNGVLPLSQSLLNIAVIGEDATAGRLGGYSGPGNGTINILDGLKKALSLQTQVKFSMGYTRSEKSWEVVNTKYLSHNQQGKRTQGLQANYFDNTDLQGEPTVSRVDPQVNFSWTLSAPDSKLSKDFYSVRWKGQLKSPGTGTYKIGLAGNDGFRLFINNQLHIDRWQKQSFSEALRPFKFEAGKQYDVRIEFREPVGNASIKLIWDANLQPKWKQRIEEAAKTAAQSDLAIVVAGIHEGEFQDRAYLNLDCHQEELIEAVAATGKPVVVLLVGGSAITMSKWMDKVQAIGSIWYPGESAGPGVADVLTGKSNPAGRLPITFPIHESQLPLSYWHHPTGRGNDYHNLTGLPLFPFGFGLSYSTFAYSNLRLSQTNIRKTDNCTVTVSVSNTSKRDGEEVVQLYLRDNLASLTRPEMELKGFQRVFLKAGETKNLSFTITPDMLQFLDLEEKPVIEPGTFRVMVGASSRDIRLKTNLEVVE